jgi:hypothetical protein
MSFQPIWLSSLSPFFWLHGMLCVCVCVYVCAYMCACVSVCMCYCVCTCVCAYMCVCVNTNVCPMLHRRANVCSCVCLRVPHNPTHKLTHTHAHAQTHKPTQMLCHLPTILNRALNRQHKQHALCNTHDCIHQHCCSYPHQHHRRATDALPATNNPHPPTQNQRT